MYGGQIWLSKKEREIIKEKESKNEKPKKP